MRDAGLTIRGDFGLNVFNSRSLDYLRRKEVSSACLSFELRFPQMRDIQKLIPAEAIVYGRLPLMITENCLVQNETGCHLSEAGDARPNRLLPKPNDAGTAPGKVPAAPGLRPPDGDPEQCAGVAGGQVGVEALRPDLCPPAVHLGTPTGKCADIFRAYQTGAPPPAPSPRDSTTAVWIDPTAESHRESPLFQAIFSSICIIETI